MNALDSSAVDVADVASYRTPSGLAIAALIIGLASPLCFVTPILMLVPLVGAAISFAALRRIAASDGALIGRTAALVGLALAIVCGFAAISHSRVARLLHASRAAELGPPWIELLLAGRVEEAFRLTSAGAKYDPTAVGEETPTTLNDPFERFKATPVVAALAAIGPGAEVRLEGTTRYDSLGGGRCWIQQRYHVRPVGPATPSSGLPRQPLEVLLTLSLEPLPNESRFTWLVASAELGGSNGNRP